MRLLGFVEGANPNRGGNGLSGVPRIYDALAKRGHETVLNICGELAPGTSELLDQGQDATRSSPPSGLAVRLHSAHGRWSFSPEIIRGVLPSDRDVDFVLLHSLYSFPVLAGYMFAKMLRRPYGVFLHGVLAPFQRRVGARKKCIYDLLLGRRILDEANVLLYTAAGEREESSSLRLRAPSVVIPLGIEPRKYREYSNKGHFRSKFLGGHSGPVVLYLGRLNAKKGLDLLAAAMTQVADRVPDVKLAIVGSGDPPSFEQQTRRFLAMHGLLDRSVMTGLLVGEDKIAAYADADVFVLPSHAENFGHAMFEALASSVPVVVSSSLNLAPEVERYGAGFVVERKPDKFAAAIIRLLENVDERRRMGEHGQRMAEAYSWATTGERLEGAIKSILQGTAIAPDLMPRIASATLASGDRTKPAPGPQSGGTNLFPELDHPIIRVSADCRSGFVSERHAWPGHSERMGGPPKVIYASKPVNPGLGSGFDGADFGSAEIGASVTLQPLSNEAPPRPENASF